MISSVSIRCSVNMPRLRSRDLEYSSSIDVGRSRDVLPLLVDAVLRRSLAAAFENRRAWPAAGGPELDEGETYAPLLAEVKQIGNLVTDLQPKLSEPDARALLTLVKAPERLAVADAGRATRTCR
jgi:hypothetical protein